MTLPGCRCGAPAFAIKPGREPVKAPIRVIDSDVDLTLIPGARDEAWCRACWPWRPLKQQTLFEETT